MGFHWCLLKPYFHRADESWRLFKNDNGETTFVIDDQRSETFASAFVEHFLHGGKARWEFFCVKLQGQFEMRYGDRPGVLGMRVHREIPYSPLDQVQIILPIHAADLLKIAPPQAQDDRGKSATRGNSLAPIYLP